MKIDLTLVAMQIDESCEAKDATKLKRLIETCLHLRPIHDLRIQWQWQLRAGITKE